MRWLILLALLPLACSSHPPKRADQFDISGEWIGKAKDGSWVSYVFQRSGEAVRYGSRTNTPALPPREISGRYLLRPTFPVWQLDIDRFRGWPYANARYEATVQKLSDSKIVLDGRLSP